jgi:thymidylate synthase
MVIIVAYNNKHNVPYNIASYATLALILEKITGYKALAIQGDLKKVHLYDNSLDAVKGQLSRDVDKYNKCELKMDTLTEVQLQKDINLINDIEPESFKLQNYESYQAINVEMLERDK